MIGGIQKNLKETIVELLLKKPASSKRLKTLLAEHGFETTIQGVYKQLNSLLDEGVILKNKQIYTISNEWIKTLSNMLAVQEIELPQEGEKFTYKFNSLQNLDEHWKHVMSSFRKKFPKEAFFSYCPHQIWIYVPSRNESELKMFNEHIKERYYNFYLIGGNTFFDKIFKKKYQNDFLRIETFFLKGEKRNQHLSVFENIIVTTSFNKSLADEIDVIFNSENNVEVQEKKIKQLLSKEYKCTFIIERNKNKAFKLKKKISQPFYLPEEVRQQIKNHAS